MRDIDSIVITDANFFLREPRGDIFIFPFGKINTKILNHLFKTLRTFYAGLNYQIGIKVEKSLLLDEAYKTGEFYDSDYFIGVLNFINALRNNPEKINIGITEVGVFNGEIDHPRFGVGNHRGGIISTYRFKLEKDSKEKLKERVGKEAIKVLSFAYGLRHCQKEECLLSYHPTVESLDRSLRLCKGCKREFTAAILEYHCL